MHLDLKYDISEIHKIYDTWPEMAQEAYQTDYAIANFKNIDHIIFSGMGGSGTVGDIMASIFSKTKIHVTVVKGYLLPKTVDSNTLVIITSVSGNTAETLNIAKSVINQTKNILAFSDGGKLEAFCKENKIEHKNIKKFHSPRASLPQNLYTLLKILKNILPLNNSDIEESLLQLKLLRNKINSSNLSTQNPSLNLAEWITDIPLIYYPWGLQSAAIRFKNSLQENAKTHTIAEDVIEACHNGIVGWETSSSIQPILIQGTDDYIKTKERWKILKEYFDEKNIDYYQVLSIQGNILSKIIHLIYLLDYSSIYLAVKNQIDPTPILSIDFIKNRLNS